MQYQDRFNKLVHKRDEERQDRLRYKAQNNVRFEKLIAETKSTIRWGHGIISTTLIAFIGCMIAMLHYIANNLLTRLH